MKHEREFTCALVVPRICTRCPFRTRCPKLTNPLALGYCQEGAAYLLFLMLLTLELYILF